MSGFVRLSGEFLVIDRRSAPFVAAGIDLLVARARAEGLPASVVGELRDLAGAARAVASDPVAPATPVVDGSGCIPAGWLSVNATRSLLRCSRQNVLGRLRPGGPLVGRKDESGRWWIDPASVDEFMERRAS